MKQLRALIIEDRQDDADLLVLALERLGYDVQSKRVWTEQTLRDELVPGRWDIIFSDFSMPSFNALGALRVHAESGLDLPFIILSGTIGEEAAVDALKAGAHDFLAKGRLARLGPAVERELREAAGRAARREADAALRESELRFRELMEVLPEVVLVHQDFRVVYANDAAASQLGFSSAEEMLGLDPREFAAPEERAYVESRMKRLTEPGALLLAEKDVRWRTRDGQPRVMQVISRTVRRGESLAIMTVARDVTEQRKMEAQLLVSDRMASIGTLAAGVAHEINNPLAVVVANLPFIQQELKAQGFTPSPDLADALRETQEATQRVRQIVLDLKLFSRDTGPERLEPVQLPKVLESSIRMARNEIRHRARLVTDFRKIPEVKGNEGRLGQVFLNLIVNAAQAIPEGQVERNEIRVGTALGEDGRIVVEVQDTGPGMPPEILANLFTPFFTTKPAGIGTGLGLSICQRIVAAHGGEIQVSSERGRGTTFRVFLERAHGQADAKVEAPRSSTGQPRGSILVIDDEVMIGKIIQRALKAHHDVSAVQSAAEALKLLDGGASYDVILCDLMMPHMTGMEFHARLLETHPRVADRVVFLSGGAFTEATRQFLETTTNERLDKPFDVVELAGFVARRIQETTSRSMTG